MRSTLVLLAVLLACGGSSDQGAITTPDKTALPETGGEQTGASGQGSDQVTEEAKGARRMLALFAELNRAMTDHVENRGQDCSSFTTTLGGWLAKDGDEIRDLLILDHRDTDHERIDASIMETATVVVFGAAECGDSDEALAAYNEWDALVL